MKSTILYTTLQNNIGPVINQGSDESTKTHDSNEIEETNRCITSEDFEIMMAKDVEGTENDFRSPFPKERKRMSIEQEKLSGDGMSRVCIFLNIMSTCMISVKCFACNWFCLAVRHRCLFMLLGQMVLYP